MSKRVPVQDIPEGKRVDLHGMEFKLAGKRKRTQTIDTFEGVMDRTYYELHLTDGLSEFEDTGQMYITRDPTAELLVLDDDEHPEPPKWQWFTEKTYRPFFRKLRRKNAR